MITQHYKDTIEALHSVKSFDEFEIISNDYNKLLLLCEKKKYLLTYCLNCNISMLLLTKISRYCSKQYNFCSIKCTNEAQRNDGILKQNKEKYFENKYGEGIKNPFQAADVIEKTKQSLLLHHGVTHPQQSKEIREKTEQTNIKRYGTKCASQSQIVIDKQQKTFKERYKVNSIAQLPQTKETLKNKYNVDNVFQLPEVKAKIVKTCLDRYGVPYPMQNPDICNKAQSHQNRSFKKGYFFSAKNDKEIRYDSSYELRALELLEQNIDVTSFERCKDSIKYVLDNKAHRYFPDIIVTYANNSRYVIEVKPNYLLKEPEIIAKSQAAISFYSQQNISFEIWTEANLNL